MCRRARLSVLDIAYSDAIFRYMKSGSRHGELHSPPIIVEASWAREVVIERSDRGSGMLVVMAPHAGTVHILAKRRSWRGSLKSLFALAGHIASVIGLIRSV